MDKEFDEFDLLESKVDAKDIKTILKMHELENDIEMEKIRIKAKYFFKFSF